MPKPILPTLTEAQAHRDIIVAIKRLHTYGGDLEGRLQALDDRITAQGRVVDQNAAIAARQAIDLSAGLTNPSPPPPAGGSPSTPPVPSPSAPDLPPQPGTGDIRVGGLIFTDGALVRWKWIGCSDFMLYYRYLDAGGSAGGGAATIAPVLANRAGFNTLRVFSMLWNIVHFDPAAYPSYFTDLSPFAAQLRAAGFQCELTVLADCALVPNMASQAQQGAHYQAVVQALSGVPNVFIEVGNEWAGNNWTPGVMLRPSGILSSSGSNGAGGDPPRAAWDYATIHGSRDAEWPRKAKDLQDFRDGPGNPGYVPLLRPCVMDEIMGAAEAAIPGSRSDVPDDFYWWAATSLLFGAGSTFHSDDGVNSVVFEPVQGACAAAFLSAVGAVPSDAQTLSYSRGGFSDFPLTHDDTWYLRAYGKLDTHVATCVIIRPTGLWPGPVAVAPWVIASTTGPGGNTLVTLTR